MLIADSKPRIFKPRGAVQLDWAHPLTRGLQFAVLFGDAKPSDLVRGYASTPTNSPRTIAIPEPGWGAAFNVPVAGTGYHSFSGAVADTQYLGPISIVWRGIVNQTGAYTQFAVKTAINSGTATPFEFRTDNGTPPKLVLVRAGGALDQFSLGGPSITINTLQTYGATNLATNTPTPTTYYINGVPSVCTTAATNTPYTSNTSPIQVGRRPDGVVQLIGSALLCYIWSRVLTPAEMLWIHREPYAFIVPKVQIPFLGIGGVIPVRFRRTLSSVGTHVGGRQAQIGG